jgi:hypothetical protein
VGHTFSSGAIKSWSRGCARPPSPRVKAREVTAWEEKTGI